LQLEIAEPKGSVDCQRSLDQNQKHLTCILCPKGCQILISKPSADDTDYHITGFCCQKGKSYALDEFEHPRRTVTTSVKLIGGIHPLLAVRTDAPVSKELIPKVIVAARKISCSAPVSLGTVLIENVAESGANLISSCEISAEDSEAADETQ
jgi:CxxC motif-containing protein